MLTSDVSVYRYVKTEAFEAVVLPTNRAYMLAVLPATGHDLHGLVRELAASPEAIDAALKRQVGTVTMPPFQIRVESNLRRHLEEMGIRQIFKDLGQIIKIPESRLTEINQSVNIQVDRLGIRADAETVGGGIYGGTMGATEPFSMKLNRPFVFLIRDLTTDALLFLGAVVDPSLK
jgi:serpin B